MMRCRQSDPAVKSLPSSVVMLPMMLLMPHFQQNLRGRLKMGTAMQAAPFPVIPEGAQITCLHLSTISVNSVKGLVVVMLPSMKRQRLQSSLNIST